MNLGWRSAAADREIDRRRGLDRPHQPHRLHWIGLVTGCPSISVSRSPFYRLNCSNTDPGATSGRLKNRILP